MSYQSTSKTIEVNGMDVDMYCTFDMVDNGIGHYECHGYKGYDSQIEPDISEILYDKDKHTFEEQCEIDQYIDDNFDDLCYKLFDVCIEAANEEPDYEYEYDY